MNDTTRELGGALGVAVLGAILSATYVDKIGETLAHVPAQIREGLESSLAVALEVAKSLGPAAAEVSHTAMEAFMSGVSHAALIAAGIIFTSAIIAFVGLPKHASKDDTTI